jgi:hypothetical protein
MPPGQKTPLIGNRSPVRQLPPSSCNWGNLQVSFTPDGRHLLTVNGNGNVYVFRLAPSPGKDDE